MPPADPVDKAATPPLEAPAYLSLKLPVPRWRNW